MLQNLCLITCTQHTIYPSHRFLPTLDEQQTASIPQTEARADVTSLVKTEVKMVPRSLRMMTLQARNMVMVTVVIKRILLTRFCGEDDMNWKSLIQSSRQIERRGSRRPLSTWARRITKILSAEKY